VTIGSSIFWDLTSCSLVKVSQARNSVKQAAKREAYFLTLKLEGLCCPETSVDCDRITRRCISHDIRHSLFYPCKHSFTCRFTWVWNLVSLREGITQTERAFENKVPRRISGLKRGEAKRESIKWIAKITIIYISNKIF
jgi:hypothetical protein